MTGQRERIALDDLTSDALDALYDRLALLENGARERSAILEEARDALEAAGINEAHGGESWPRLVPAIEELAADRAGWKARFERVQERVGELETDNHRYEEVVVGDLNEANIGLQRQLAEEAEEHRQAHEAETENTAREIARALAAGARVRELEAQIARLTPRTTP
ncbi:hypothetical protein [Streptomyces sp. NPDC018055]|uniref:hypothetical protein n=1 Tax=Streptomyces sp. NPDC018055 TaxID=3365038 RepID=UPI0037971358